MACSDPKGGGTITGTTTVPADSKSLPDATVFDQYTSMAREIPFSSDFSQIHGTLVVETTSPDAKVVLGPLAVKASRSSRLAPNGGLPVFLSGRG